MANEKKNLSKEEEAAIRAEFAKLQADRDRRKAYSKRPEVVERRKAYGQRPEVVEARKARQVQKKKDREALLRKAAELGLTLS